MNTEFRQRADRVAYLVAVEKLEGLAEEARILAREVLNDWGRETCPITGQQYFYVCEMYGGETLRDWVTPHKPKLTPC